MDNTNIAYQQYQQREGSLTNDLAAAQAEDSRLARMAFNQKIQKKVEEDGTCYIGTPPSNASARYDFDPQGVGE